MLLFPFQEGDAINTDVTCPSAIIALALIYLKTNNRWDSCSFFKLLATFMESLFLTLPFWNSYKVEINISLLWNLFDGLINKQILIQRNTIFDYVLHCSVVSNWLCCPDTTANLETIKPDNLLLMVILLYEPLSIK